MTLIIGARRHVPTPDSEQIFLHRHAIIKPNEQNIETSIIRQLQHDYNQISHNDKDHQVLLCGWSKFSPHKSKMADGRQLENRKIAPSCSFSTTVGWLSTCNKNLFLKLWSLGLHIPPLQKIPRALMISITTDTCACITAYVNDALYCRLWST